MAKNKIITSEGNVQFIFGDTGKVINVHPFHIYTSFNEDTVSFLLLPMPKSSGLAIFTSKAEDLEFDGVTYSFSELPAVIAEAFAEAGAKARWEIVQTLPASGRSNTIYLVPKEDGTGYDEYIWIKDEERWELIGDTDIELWRYLKKDDFNAYSAATKDYIDSVSGKVDTEIERATSAETALSTAIFNESVDRAAADNVLSGAIDTVSSALTDEVSARTEADSALSGAIDTVSSALTDEISARTEADSVISGAVDDLSTALANEISARTSADTAFDERLTEDERVWGAALNDLNSRINTVSGDVASETSARTEADNALSGAIDTKFDASAITAYSTTVEVGNAIEAATSGKVDTSAFTAYSASVETELSGKQDTLSAGTNITIVDNVISAEGGGKAISAGTNISVTTGETADTVSCTLNLENGTNSTSGGLVLKSYAAGNKASGRDAIAFGGGNEANGTNSFVCGYYNTGNTSTAFVTGYKNITTNLYESLFGLWSLSNGNVTNDFTGNSGATMFAVGNGNWREQIRHNAFEVRQNGDIYIADTNDTSTSNYYQKPMIKLQDALGGGGSITVDPTLDSGSTNAVANSAITEAFENVESRLTEDEEVTAAGLNALNDRLSEDEEVTAAGLNAVNDKFDGLKLKKLTQTQYDNLQTKDNMTLYIIVD